MQYMLLIMEPAGQRRERGEVAGRQLHERMLRFGDALRSRGVLVSSQSLRSDDAGIRVRVRDGKSTLIDGPFAEAKEIVGGFFLLDATSSPAGSAGLEPSANATLAAAARSAVASPIVRQFAINRNM